MSQTTPILLPFHHATPHGTWQQELQSDLLASEMKKAFDWADGRIRPEYRDIISVARTLIQNGDVKFRIDEAEGNTCIARIDADFPRL